MAIKLGKLLAIWAVVIGAIWTTSQAQAFGSQGLLCDRQGARLERRFAIPSHLLRAISLAESGRWDAQKEEKIAWPWTVTSQGQGQYYPTRKAAIAAVRKLQAQGVRNIDVGCMQINLYYHPDAFQNLAQAFDPATNIGYAAKFLTRLFKETKTWSLAVAHYHSRDRKRGKAYREKVVRLWNEARHDAKVVRDESQVAAVGGSLHRPRGGYLPVSKGGMMPSPKGRELYEGAGLADPKVMQALNQVAAPSRTPWQDWRRTMGGKSGRVLPRSRDRRGANMLSSMPRRPAGGKSDFAAKRRAQLAAWRTDKVWR